MGPPPYEPLRFVAMPPVSVLLPQDTAVCCIPRNRRLLVLRLSVCVYVSCSSSICTSSNSSSARSGHSNPQPHGTTLCSVLRYTASYMLGYLSRHLFVPPQNKVLLFSNESARSRHTIPPPCTTGICLVLRNLRLVILYGWLLCHLLVLV